MSTDPSDHSRVVISRVAADLAINTTAERTSEVKIEDLCSEIFHQIFRYFDLMERIRLRSVSKTFKEKIDELLREQTDLVVSRDYTINNRWYHSDTSFSIVDHLILAIDMDLTPSFGFNKLERIKLERGLHESGFKLLEKFKKLAQVEMGWLNLKDDVTVRFDVLKTLWIGKIIGKKKFRLTLNAPLLDSVYFGEDAICHVQFSNQASVRFVEFQLDHDGSSLKFQNSEIVKCSLASSLSEQILCKLIQLPRLAELHCSLLEISALHYQPEAEGPLERLFSFLIAQHAALQPHRRCALNIYIHHVRITNRIKMRFDQYFFMGVLLSTHNRNHDYLAERISSVKYVDFEKFQQVRVSHKFVSMLNDLYPCIQQVALIAPNSSALYRPFIQFLQSRLSISHLDLQFLGFDSVKKQELFDTLPKLASLRHSLTKLKLLDNSRPDFSFLFKFELLRQLKTNLMTKTEAMDVVEKFKHPNFFEFELESRMLCVEKKTFKNEYCLTIKEGHTIKIYPVQTFSQLKETIDSTIRTHQHDALTQWHS